MRHNIRHKVNAVGQLGAILPQGNGGDDGTPETLFLTGKGGVGKTTTSCSLSLLLSSRNPSKNVLLVSTDPAHSIHDCLMLPKPVSPVLEQFKDNMYITELDVRSSPLNKLTSSNIKSALDLNKITDTLGIDSSILQTFGVDSILSDISEILTSEDGSGTSGLFPPGSDELLALLSLSNYLTPSGEPFDYIVVDTAPSGHTIRMLNGPKFIDTSLGKLLMFKGKVNGIMEKITAFTGAKEKGKDEGVTLDTLLEDIDDIQLKLRKFISDVDSGKNKFAVVSIPTKLSYEESVRVVRDLNLVSSKGRVTDIVVNQVLGDGSAEVFWDRKVKSNKKQIDVLKKEINGQANVISVPYIDTEITGGAGLSYLGNMHFEESSFSDDFFEGPGENDQTRVTVFGGKGGVGKTTTSSTVAIKLMKLGHKVAIISTDPAHSLGDAFSVKLNGEGVDLTGEIYDNTSDGTLKGYEIDPEAAVSEFKELINNLSVPDSMGGVNMNDLTSILDTLPPGADEVIALSKIIDLVKKGGYTRVILDTAPTGHTVKMLTFPRYIDDVIEKVVRVTDRLKSTAMMVNKNIKEEDIEAAKVKLLGFQLKMFELDELFGDPEKSEFVIVTIATEMAVKESVRLFEELKNGEVRVKVENVVVNQVAVEGGESGMDRIRGGQKKILDKFDEFAKEEGIDITRVALTDEEPKSEYGLRSLWPSYEVEVGINNN
ncbi:hypothetical protein TrST_g4998 [Triparma strigata]|uniref:AAA+ ATPase domain-containing protein n=1 Tax=Triparma strigata TaxID=1606541 RepID=A0A9W7APL8_9STRA|nr:hypothetical protein TrST_g4998 [Triparma strigata]